MSLHSMRRALREFACSPAPQLSAAAIGWQFANARAWLWLLPPLAAASAFAWVSVYRRQRAISDTPTSTINGAAQGYVELHGSAEQPTGSEIRSPLTSLPCVWYKFVTEERRDNKWRVVNRGESDASFALQDETGRCVIDPEHAEVRTKHKQRWTRGDYRYTEYLLLPKDRLYAIGEFATVNPVETRADTRQEVGALLADWKTDKASLHERFDLDGDGELNDQEWTLARAEAKRQVGRREAEFRAQPGIHVMRMPKDGRPFVIANFDSGKLVTRYRFWGYFHVAAIVAATIAWGVLLARR